ncbi:MAG: VanW family protein [Myxococcota bacterium]
MPKRDSAAPREASPVPDRPGPDRPGPDRPGPDGADVGEKAPPGSRRRRATWLLVLLAPVVVFFSAFAGSRLLSRGEVLAGVRVGGPSGLSLGGMTRVEAAAAIEELAARMMAEPVVVTAGDRRLEVAPADVGFVVDQAAMVEAAMAAGRTGGIGRQIQSWVDGSADSVGVVGTIDAARLEPFFARWEQEVLAQPTFEGALRAREGRVVLEPPRAGRVVTRESMVPALTAALKAVARAPIPLASHEQAPQRTAASWTSAIAEAEALISAAVTLGGVLPPDARERDGQEKTRKRPPAAGEQDEPSESPSRGFSIAPDVLATALRSRTGSGTDVALALDPEALKPALAEARQALERPPVDARFDVSKGDEVTVVPSRLGRVIDAAKVAEALLAAASRPDRTGPFPIEDGAAPALTTEAARALNIRGLVSKFTTSHRCCEKRVKNIHRMADLIDGVVLAPGERFSINEHVGERRASHGFYPAPTIVHGEMKDTVGGGVSQFATTFYNAFFHGGYEIIERQPHSFYFRRYPMGHEATLSFPKPDVIVRNDTKSGLLIRTEYGGTYIRIKLYGDNEGRKVKRKVSRIYDVTDPPIEYIADPGLEPDETKVKVRGKVGWTVTVSRIVEYADGETKKETRKVTYKPRVKKLRVHPCKVPEGEDGYTGEPCPEPEEEEDDDDDDEGPDRRDEAPEPAPEPAKDGEEPFDPNATAPPVGEDEGG